MKIKYLYIIISLAFFNLSCKSQIFCTENITLNNETSSLDKSTYTFIFNNSSKIDPTIIIVGKKNYNHISSNANIVLLEESNVSQFLKEAINDSLKKIKVNYTFVEKGKKFEKLFKDGHTNFYKYISINADTLSGRIIESYQKYDSIFIGTHRWYDYELKNNKPTLKIKQEINYDSIYPICFCKAYKIARKMFGKKHINVNSPKDYPNRKQEKNAFWEFYNDEIILKIDAYSGEIINKK
ncbi:hypothetical protein HNQ02_001477 [Flavobacterium sp. 7E]|uniref:hypothetical protein n=1 Tax=Flavobacterium sp. 7E TaxID=2735898 RepID=UPI00156FDE81|nr:hypothetical protein [Flavobacterium sp. 7E]NRS88563.1 hypothetical protein [Flavobacterium sp. 7E]